MQLLPINAVTDDNAAVAKYTRGAAPLGADGSVIWTSAASRAGGR